MSIIIEDQTEELTLLHYKGVQEDTNQDIKNIRGQITDDQQNIICSSFGYTQEYTVNQKDKYHPLLKDLSKCVCYKSEEGSLLRLFYYEHRWRLSTFKRIDAFESRWSSRKTFGELFVDALSYFFTDGAGKDKLSFEKDDIFDVFCNTLNRSLVYTFLLRTNKDTKIVCRPPEHPTVYFGGSFSDNVRSIENDTMIPSPEKLEFGSVDELDQFVQKVDPFEYQGVIIMLPDQTTIKVIQSDALTYKNIRGSEPDIDMSYFRVRKNKSELDLFTRIFTEVSPKDMEDQLKTMTLYLHRMYVRRFIKKLYTILHPTLFHVLRKAHTWHSENRKSNIVTLEKMTELIEEQSYSNIYRMYHEFKEQASRRLVQTTQPVILSRPTQPNTTSS